jgi:hypothetical protein
MDSRQQIAQPQEGISRSIIGQEHIVERLLLAGIVCLLLLLTRRRCLAVQIVAAVPLAGMHTRQQIAQPQEGISRSIIGQEHIVERLLLAGIVCLLLLGH